MITSILLQDFQIKSKDFLSKDVFSYIFNTICYPATLFVIVSDITNGMLSNLVGMSEHQTSIVVWCLIVLYALKIAWYAYSKFYLERRERLEEIRRKRKGLA